MKARFNTIILVTDFFRSNYTSNEEKIKRTYDLETGKWVFGGQGSLNMRVEGISQSQSIKGMAVVTNTTE